MHPLYTMFLVRLQLLKTVPIRGFEPRLCARLLSSHHPCVGRRHREKKIGRFTHHCSRCEPFRATFNIHGYFIGLPPCSHSGRPISYSWSMISCFDPNASHSSTHWGTGLDSCTCSRMRYVQSLELSTANTVRGMALFFHIVQITSPSLNLVLYFSISQMF